MKKGDIVKVKGNGPLNGKRVRILEIPTMTRRVRCEVLEHAPPYRYGSEVQILAHDLQELF